MNAPNDHVSMLLADSLVRVTRATCLKCGKVANCCPQPNGSVQPIPAVVSMAWLREKGAHMPHSYLGCDGQMQIEMEPVEAQR